MQVKDQFLEKQFMKRVLKKFQINLQARVKDFYPLGTFQYKNNMDISSSQMIVVATQDSQLLLYDTSGELISDLLELDHHSQFIATSPKSDETQIVSLSHIGEIKIFKLENRRIKVDLSNSSEYQNLNTPKYAKRGSKGFNEKFKYQLRFDARFEIEKDSNITAFEYVMIKGLKYFVMGDEEGNLIVYHRNGTMDNIIRVANQPVRFILKTMSSIIFASENKLGFYNPSTREVSPPYCDQINEGIMDVQLDQNQNNIMYVLTRAKNILILEFSTSSSSCNFILQSYPEKLLRHAESALAGPAE